MLMTWFCMISHALCDILGGTQKYVKGHVNVLLIKEH